METLLRGHVTKNARYFVDGDGRGLISYHTKVLIIKDGVLFCTGLYSATTRRHIGWWLAEYCPKFTYHDIKQLYLDNMAVNIYTGEVMPLTTKQKRIVREESEMAHGNSWNIW